LKIKVKVEHYESNEKFIDIEAPYYYKNVWGDDFKQFGECSCSHTKTIAYGKITAKNVHISIEETIYKSGSVMYELFFNTNVDKNGKVEAHEEDIFLEKNKSTKEEFEAILKRAQDFIDNIIQEKSL